MAARDKFAAANTDKVYEQFDDALANAPRLQNDASPEEISRRKQTMTTQGRKGCKLPRVNMAFTPTNYEFIRVMSKGSGRTMTEFVNLVLAAYQNEHPEILEQARHFLDTLNSGVFSHISDTESAQEVREVLKEAAAEAAEEYRAKKQK